MKKIILFLMCLTTINLVLNAQSTSSRIYKYNGPKNTQELTQLLNTSTNSAIVNLNPKFKEMLVEITLFKHGRISGFDPNTTNISVQEFYKSNASGVFSALFGTEVTIVSSDVQSKAVRITASEFNKLMEGRMGFTSDPTWCYNCRGLDGGSGNPGSWCCQVGGNGCCDIIIKIDNQSYIVD